MSSIINALAARRPNRLSVRAKIRDIRKLHNAERLQRWQALAAYEGGTKGEESSAKLLKARCKEIAKRKRAEVRAAYLSRVGRRIDLGAILQERRQNGLPLWALRNPLQPVDPYGCDGKYDRDDTLGIVTVNRSLFSFKFPGISKGLNASYVPAGGIPPLPPSVRKLVTSKKIQKRAFWIGLLYQPDEWMEVRPDPAIIVEWLDRPGEYYALAVWGHDGPRIMEFVD